jgi:hypothetical protein
MAYQDANAVAITGGTIAGVAITTSTINQTPIGATTPSTGTFTNLSASGTVTLGTITGGTWQGTPIAVAYGGTGASSAPSARTNLGAAASGANSDITSLTGLTTPLSETQGGTGYGSYTTGDILYAASSSTLARLNDVATGNALISGGVGVAPSWGKIGLSTHVSGTLPVSSGGTGATTLTGYLVGNGTGAVTAVSTIPNAGLTNSSITIGSTAIALGATSTTLAGLTTVTLTQDPTAALQASTKQYVDNQVLTVSNTTFHAASSYATTAALSATYANGTGGVGATLTNSIALAALTIDGYTFTATDVTNSTRVLIKDQASGLQNGIYTVTNQGSALVAWVLTRAADFNTVGTGPSYIETGAATFVTSGSVNASTGWVMNTSGTITVGTTALTWAQTSSSSSVTVTSPLTKVGSVIGLGTVTVPFGGTGLTTLTQYSVMIGNGTGNVAFASPSTTGYALLSTGASSNPSFGQLSLTAGVTGTLPVANGGTGTGTAFTTGSVVFAGASGVYSQNNSKLFWDNTNNRLGLNTATPQTQLTILSNTQTVTPTATLPAGTDLYIVGANAANTRITQDAYGTGNYAAYTGRQARGTAASPTASQSGDFLTQLTGRGYGATGFSTASTGYFAISAAENFTDTAQGTYASVFTTALGANSATEAFRFGPAGQFGIGAGSYGTTGYVLTSAGASAAPTWSQVSATSLTGVLPVANGGTNISSYTIGDLIYASGTTTLSKLADVATGNVLLSGGVGVAPAWGQVSLTAAVTGILPIANGGTNSTATPTSGGIGYGTGTAHAYSVAGTSGQVLISGGTGAPTWATLSGVAVTALVAGTNIVVSGSTGSVTVSTIANPVFSTSTTSPLVIGGTAASSSLTLQSTSGIGTSDSILFKVGNNGATTAMSIATGGTVTIGTLNLTNALGVSYGGTGLTTTPANGALDIGNGTNFTRTTLTAGTAISVTNGAGSISIANTGVTSATAGTGISVSSANGAVTFTNTGVTSITFGSTGLTPSTATTGAVTVAGTLNVVNGGTGVTTSTGTGSNVLSASPTFTGTLNAAAITASGAITDSIGNVRDVPQNAQTSAYVLVASDDGKHISITTGGITVNSGIFSAGQSVSVYNNSSSSQTITQGTSVTMYLVGTATTGNRTLAQRGFCTIFCVASNTFVITGGGLT